MKKIKIITFCKFASTWAANAALALAAVFALSESSCFFSAVATTGEDLTGVVDAGALILTGLLICFETGVLSFLRFH